MVRKRIILILSVIVLIAVLVACAKTIEKKGTDSKGDKTADYEATPPAISIQNEETSTSALYEIAKEMYKTKFKGIESNPSYSDYKYIANTLYTITLSTGKTHTLLYSLSATDASITVDGKKLIINTSIPRELLYDKVAVMEDTDVLAGEEIFFIKYLYRTAPNGIVSVGMFFQGGEDTFGWYDYDEEKTYDIDECLQLLGKSKDEMIKRLGYAEEGNPLDNTDICFYDYGGFTVYTYKNKVCLFEVGEEKLFGFNWYTSSGGINYHEAEKNLKEKFVISKIKRTGSNGEYVIEYAKCNYKDYVIYSKIENEKIAFMFVTTKKINKELGERFFVDLWP